ncbi:MAG TPA: GAF domain-containing sensor histidine kinase [Desulfobacteraceae bacterium]|nr:GAF domain-containing sensor histidine kinase [Desulfobacteraceae bacterium]
MLINLEHLAMVARQEPWAKKVDAGKEFWEALSEWIEENVVADFLSHVTRQVDEIVEIEPDMEDPSILSRATRYMVEFLNAHHASVRIYDPDSAQMLSFGSYPYEERTRLKYIPLEGSVAGEVIKQRKTYIVPDILAEDLYHNKEVIYKKGVRSLMALPFEVPRLSLHGRTMVGVIQVYYAEENRVFSSLELQVAELFAKRLSIVLTRKRILEISRITEKKEAIIQKIYRTIGNKKGVKTKEIFDRIIPELAGFMNLQSCALFSISRSYDHVILEAGYPSDGGYHTIGESFPVSSEPAFEVLLNLRSYEADPAYEIITPSYISILSPERSNLISANMKHFARIHNINSILYVPIYSDGEITHFMTFDALDQTQRYTDAETDLFLVLSREMMKIKKMERLDDALHDFKNPAIAIAGFARRLTRLLENEFKGPSRNQALRYAGILAEETRRLQELALSIYQVGEEQKLNLTEVLKRRFEINTEAIKEQFKQNVRIEEGPYDENLFVKCYPMHLERVFDNLLNNATKAIPIQGGFLWIRTYGDGDFACAEITNTGHMNENDRLKILEGEGEGRGLYITYRIMQLIRGKIDFKTDQGTTTLVVCLPRYKE